MHGQQAWEPGDITLDSAWSGEPMAKKRPRFAGSRCPNCGATCPPGRVISSDHADEQEIAALMATQSPGHPTDGWAYRLDIVARTSRGYEGAGIKDADNIAKAVLDAANGIAWPDDRYVDYLTVRVIRNHPSPATRATSLLLNPLDRPDLAVVDRERIAYLEARVAELESRFL